jgi:hypothetical protein
VRWLTRAGLPVCGGNVTVGIYNIVAFMKASLCLLVFILTATAFPAGASVVKEEKTGDRWQLLRDGVPYFVKGACVWGLDEDKIYAPLEELARAFGEIRGAPITKQTHKARLTAPKS